MKKLLLVALILMVIDTVTGQNEFCLTKESTGYQSISIGFDRCSEDGMLDNGLPISISYSKDATTWTPFEYAPRSVYKRSVGLGGGNGSYQCVSVSTKAIDGLNVGEKLYLRSSNITRSNTFTVYSTAHGYTTTRLNTIVTSFSIGTVSISGNFNSLNTASPAALANNRHINSDAWDAFFFGDRSGILTNDNYTFKNNVIGVDMSLYDPINGMFSGWKGLKYIKVNFDSWDNLQHSDWVEGVASDGIFVCPRGLEIKYGYSYIPYNWRVVYLDELKSIHIPESSKKYINISRTTDVVSDTEISFSVVDRTAEGFALSSVSVIDENNNPVVLSQNGNVYSFTMPDGDVSINVIYTPIEYNITCSDYVSTDISKGTLYDNVYFMVEDRSSEGYMLDKVLVNGKVFADDNIELKDYLRDVYIEAVYSKIDYAITTDDDSYADKAQANVGDVIHLTFKNRTGYVLVSANYNGNELTVSNKKAEFIMPAENVIVESVYEPIKYHIITDEYVKADKEYATIEDVVHFSVEERSSNGFQLKRVLVNNADFSEREIAMKNYLQDISISAVYLKIAYRITTDDFSTVNKTIAYVGDKITVTISDRNGYELISTTCNGNPVPVANNTAEFTMPAANVEVKTNYSLIEYNIIVDGFVSANKTKATINDKVTFDIADRTSDGYKLEKVFVNNVVFSGREFYMKNYLQDVEIKTNYSPIEYNIIAGDFVTANKSKATINDKVSFSVTDRTSTGYKLEKVLVNDVEFTGSEINMKDYLQNVTITAVYSKIGYTITTDEFSTVNKTTANVGDNISVTIKNRDGYKFTSASYNGNALVVSNNKASFTMPAANVEINTTYSIIEYNVTTNEFVTANKSKATINDKVSFSVADRTADGYKLDKVLVNDAEFAAREFDMKDYLQNVTIIAVYSKIGYTITTDGFSTVNKTTANVGDNISVTIKNRDGYKFMSASYNGISLVVSNNKASFSMPAANVEINTTYSIIEYNVTTNEFVTANKSKATINDKVSFSVADRTADGYKLDKVLVNNVEFTGREINMKDYLQNVAITAVYSKIGYRITTDEFSTVNKTTANVGDNISVTIKNRDGYKFTSASYNGNALVVSNNKASFTMPAANVEINTAYSIIEYNVTTNEFVTANKSKATINDKVSFSVADRTIDGYKLDKVLVNNVEFTGREIDMKDYLQNVTISAVYSKIGYSITTDEFTTVNKTTAYVGDKITFTVADRTIDGYKLDKVLVNTVEFTGREINMKDYLQNVTITAVYSKIYNEDLFVSDMDMEVETNSYCAGDILNMTFKTNNIAKKYQILFVESAKSDGFKDTDFEDIVTPEEQSVSFEIPKTAKYGKYQGFIKVVDLYGNVSEKYPFDFNIGYPNDIIETKYSDLICVNNFKNNYTAYQWLKNGKEIVGANKQFFIDYPMLNGVYSVIVTDKGGNKIRVCDFKVKDLTSKKSTAMAVKVYPNPAISSQPVTITIDGFEENTKYEIVIYNQLGALVQRLPNAQETNIIRLQSGVYSGAVVSQKGKQTFKLIISD